jgi:hypothetical protein
MHMPFAAMHADDEMRVPSDMHSFGQINFQEIGLEKPDNMRWLRIICYSG